MCSHDDCVKLHGSCKTGVNCGVMFLVLHDRVKLPLCFVFMLKGSMLVLLALCGVRHDWGKLRSMCNVCLERLITFLAIAKYEDTQLIKF